MPWQENITKGLSFLSRGFHAVPKYDGKHTIKNFPSMHRLYNVLLMIAGFTGMKSLSDIIFGQSINGAEYKEIKKEEVFAPLRFLHGIVKYNPFSDDPRDQWLKVLHQMLPAIGGAIGAVKGSEFFFGKFGNNTEGTIKDLLARKNDLVKPLNDLEKDRIISYQQGKIWRVLAGATAWVSSASGLTVAYGVALNNAFGLNNGARTITGLAENFTLSKIPSGPLKAFEEIMKGTTKLFHKIKTPEDAKTVTEGFTKDITKYVVSPLFKKLSPQDKDSIVESIKNAIEEAYKTHHAGGKDFKTEVERSVLAVLKDPKIRNLGSGMFVANQNWLGKATEFLLGKNIKATREEIGAGATKLVQAAAHTPNKKWGIAAVLSVLGIGTAIGVASPNNASAASTLSHNELGSLSAKDYIKNLDNQREKEQNRGFVNGKLLGFAKWMGDAALAVLPVHRMWSAIGLTGGGILGLKLGELFTGARLSDGVHIAEDSFFKIAKPGYNLFEKIGLSQEGKRLAGLYTFAAFCLAGVAWGSHHAYKSTYKKNENPKSLEDYIAKVRQHHGDKFIAPVAVSSILGSASGAYMIPYVPIINYGASLSYRTVSMQDRHIMTPGLKGLTGAATNSYFSLREGTEYLCKYAIHNPSKDPVDLEYLARTLLEPLTDASGTKLTGEQIQKFVAKVHDVRDKYWKEGGIPKEDQDKLYKEMQATFKGKGLDKTLYECDIDTTKIDFNKIGGLIGKFAKFLGAKKKVAAEQTSYHELVAEWRKDWNKEVKSDTETAVDEKPAKVFALPGLKKDLTPKDDGVIPFTNKLALEEQGEVKRA